MRGVSRVDASSSCRSARTCSGRCTYGSSSGSPSPSRPATATRWVVQSGMTGSWERGRLHRAAAAAIAFDSDQADAEITGPRCQRIHNFRRQALAFGACRRGGCCDCLLAPAVRLSDGDQIRQCPCCASSASSAAQSIASVLSGFTSRRACACSAWAAKIWVVVVVTTRRPPATASSASRKSALVLPPAPTSVTTESSSGGRRRA